MHMYNFTAIFDKNYLFKGLALYHSLENNLPDFFLYILCLDKTTYDILQKLNLNKAILIKLEEIEDEDLKKAKGNRSFVEYIWTLSPCFPLYILRRYPQLEMITYLDTDLYFFSTPQPIFEEFGDNDILIIEHRFSEKFKSGEEYGKYNVGFLTFRNNDNGLNCLKWWRERCLEWCYFKCEGGKMGDQKYLEQWPGLFPKVHILKNVGANTAIWNLDNYKVGEKQGIVYIDNTRLIFFHFNQFNVYKFFGNIYYCFFTDAFFPIDKLARKMIYKVYFGQLKRELKRIKNTAYNFNFGIKKNRTFIFKISKHYIKRIFPFLTKPYLSVKRFFINLKDK